MERANINIGQKHCWTGSYPNFMVSYLQTFHIPALARQCYDFCCISQKDSDPIPCSADLNRKEVA